MILNATVLGVSVWGVQYGERLIQNVTVLVVSVW